MKIILSNGGELTPILVEGGKKIVQGATRDTLSFVFSADTSMDDLDAIFTAENCEQIAIVDGENEYIHKGYTVRAGLKREPVEIARENGEENAAYENRVFVSMSQRTYAESQMADMQATINTLLSGEV